MSKDTFTLKQANDFHEKKMAKYRLELYAYVSMLEKRGYEPQTIVETIKNKLKYD